MSWRMFAPLPAPKLEWSTLTLSFTGVTYALLAPVCLANAEGAI
jgi:hypothetical protein